MKSPDVSSDFFICNLTDAKKGQILNLYFVDRVIMVKD